MGKQRVNSNGDWRSYTARLSRAIALFVTLSTALALAQINAATTPSLPADSSSPTPTLHVYTNLRQVPVLVLSHDYKRMKPVDTSGFRLSLDFGPRFRPTYVRREADDPISLAIVIDESDPQSDLLPALAEAIAALPPDFLHPQDHVSVYAVDCSLIRTTYDASASPPVLADGVQRAMAPWQIRQAQNEELKKQKKAPPPPCKISLPLWDSMAEVLLDLDQQPGRRVLLAITNGEDTGSKILWKDVMLHSQLHSVTVFGLLPPPKITVAQKAHEVEIFHAFRTLGAEDKFAQICANSGGIQLQANEHTAMFQLKEFTQMLRERYILEFPRAANEEAGIHTLAVSYRKKSDLYIASSGISVPVASEDEKKGPNTIQGDPSKKPTEGDRKVLLPK
jgi:hypothetical protein